MKASTLTIAALLGTTAVASAGSQTVLATLGNTLYRTSNGGATIDTFTLPDDITSLEITADGTIYGASRTDDDNDGFFELYRLDGAFGAAPSLAPMGDFLANNTPSLMYANGTLYGFQHTPGGADNSNVVSIDVGAGTQTTVGTISARINSSGFDDANGAAWGLNRGSDTTSLLHSIDLGTPSSASVGDTGYLSFNSGGEFFGGTLYRAVENGNNFVFGSIDTSNGDFTQLFELSATVPAVGVGSRDVGLVVVPTPGAAGLIALGGLAAVVRRRRA